MGDTAEKVKLLISQEDAKEGLNERIKAGYKLLDINIFDMQDLERAKGEAENWHSYNKRYLQKIFSNESVLNEYNIRELAFGAISAALRSEILLFESRVKGRIQRLKALKNELSLIDKEEPDKQNLKDKEERRKERRDSVARDFIIQIGDSPSVSTVNGGYKENPKKNLNENFFGPIITGLIIGILLIIIGYILYYMHLPTTLVAPSANSFSVSVTPTVPIRKLK